MRLLACALGPGCMNVSSVACFTLSRSKCPVSRVLGNPGKLIETHCTRQGVSAAFASVGEQRHTSDMPSLALGKCLNIGTPMTLMEVLCFAERVMPRHEI